MIRFLPYVAKSVARNRVRTVLTVSGVGVAVLLVSVLAALQESRARAQEAASDTVLLVSQKDVF